MGIVNLCSKSILTLFYSYQRNALKFPINLWVIKMSRLLLISAFGKTFATFPLPLPRFVHRVSGQTIERRKRGVKACVYGVCIRCVCVCVRCVYASVREVHSKWQYLTAVRTAYTHAF